MEPRVVSRASSRWKSSRFILPEATRDACLAYPWMSPHFMDAKGYLIMSIHGAPIGVLTAAPQAKVRRTMQDEFDFEAAVWTSGRRTRNATARTGWPCPRARWRVWEPRNEGQQGFDPPNDLGRSVGPHA